MILIFKPDVCAVFVYLFVHLIFAGTNATVAKTEGCVTSVVRLRDTV